MSILPLLPLISDFLIIVLITVLGNIFMTATHEVIQSRQRFLTFIVCQSVLLVLSLFFLSPVLTDLLTTYARFMAPIVIEFFILLYMWFSIHFGYNVNWSAFIASQIALLISVNILAI